MIIIKLDFEKAFEKVEYSTTIAMLNQLGFGN